MTVCSIFVPTNQIMEEHTHQEDYTPADCFRLEELEQMQSFENQTLEQVNYYFWVNQLESETMPLNFLFFLELVFTNLRSLLLTSGEDSEAIRVSNAEELVKTAEVLRALHNRIVIQRVGAENFPLWADVQGKVLTTIQLSKNAQGLYANDALLLNFDAQKILVRLSQREGLEVGKY